MLNVCPLADLGTVGHGFGGMSRLVELTCCSRAQTSLVPSEVTSVRGPILRSFQLKTLLPSNFYQSYLTINL